MFQRWTILMQLWLKIVLRVSLCWLWLQRMTTEMVKSTKSHHFAFTFSFRCLQYSQMWLCTLSNNRRYGTISNSRQRNQSTRRSYSRPRGSRQVCFWTQLLRQSATSRYYQSRCIRVLHNFDSGYVSNFINPAPVITITLDDVNDNRPTIYNTDITGIFDESSAKVGQLSYE